MTSRINYSTPLKSVRTVRALKLQQYDPQKAFVDDPARPSDADLMHDAGVAFVWENAPGRSKAEQEAEVVSPVELKPPPQVLAPRPNSKLFTSGEMSKFPPPIPAGTEANGRSFHHFHDSRQLPTPEAAATAARPDNPTPPVRSQPTSANHQLPPKPTKSRSQSLSLPLQQSGDKPPQPRRTTSAAASVSQSGHHSSELLSRNGGHEQPPARRTGKTRGQEVPLAKEGPHHHHNSSLASTLHSFTTSDEEAFPFPDHYAGGSGIGVPTDKGKSGPAHRSTLSQGNQDYLTAKLRQSQSPALGVKDFYLSGRHTQPSAVSNSTHATRPSSCLPTRPNSASCSEAGSHSDDGGETDVGDSCSIMNARDPDGRCQVSVVDGEHHESSNRHTDPRARDFIMERFLPAAKAMVTETPDSAERRSSQEAPSVSPTRKNGRSSLIGRSRFAFKDQFTEEGDEQEDDVDQADLLFKCKFPWQMGALRSVAPQITHPDSESAEQSPSPSFAKNKFSPSPTVSLEHRKEESSPRPFSDGQHDDGAWVYAESDGSATPRGESISSFEARGLPPKSRNKNGAAIHRSEQHSGQSDYHHDSNRDSNRSLGLIGESANGAYESEHSGFRSNESSYRRSPAFVLKDRFLDTATQGDIDTRGGSLGNSGRDIAYSGSLGSLLRTSQQQRRDLGRNSEAAIQAAVANVQLEAIPPASILNHHRNGPARAAAAAAAMSSSAYGIKHSTTTKPNYPGDSAHRDESNGYPKHIKVNLIMQQEVEPSGGSGRSLESLNDEVWESAREFPLENFDPSGKMNFTSNNNSSHFFESANESVPVSSGWPLKVQQMYARTPSSDSKDASFSSVSELSLRSPTNLAMAVQQQPSSTEKYSPVSVLQPPLPKSPNDSWLFKVRPPAPPSTGTNWQGPKPKKFLDYSSPDDSMDVKWEALVKSENAQLRSKMAQEQKVGGGHH